MILQAYTDDAIVPGLQWIVTILYFRPILILQNERGFYDKKNFYHPERVSFCNPISSDQTANRLSWIFGIVKMDITPFCSI